jgi:dihydrodipicolinate synthase/N-acetylneuraminate lyase
VVPELVVALYKAASIGDLTRAQKLQTKLNAVRAILRDGADLSLFKGVLVQRGLSVGTVRKPLLQASEAALTECCEALTALDLTLNPI